MASSTPRTLWVALVSWAPLLAHSVENIEECQENLKGSVDYILNLYRLVSILGKHLRRLPEQVAVDQKAMYERVLLGEWCETRSKGSPGEWYETRCKPYEHACEHSFSFARVVLVCED
jgi:hypothetical protein